MTQRRNREVSPHSASNQSFPPTVRNLQPKLWTPAARLQATVVSASQIAEPEVWLVRKLELGVTADLDCQLTSEEQLRRNRFRDADDRWRFSAGRAVLRQLLGQHLNVAPWEVDLASSRHGKPFVPTRGNQPIIHFNIAHSGDLILLAFHPDWEVGGDVEQITDQHDWHTVARQLFSSDQYRAWSLLDDKQRQRAFFQAWTRREAGLKAIGSGFAVEQTASWDKPLTFFNVELPAGYAGATAVFSPY